MPAHLRGPKPSSRHAPPPPQCSLADLGPVNSSLPAGSDGFVLVPRVPQPTRGCTLHSRERVHCFLPRFVLRGANATHQLQGQTLTCFNLVFRMVDEECGANKDWLGPAANFFISCFLLFWPQKLLGLQAWRGGSALFGESPPPSSGDPQAFPDILFLDYRKAASLGRKLRPRMVVVDNGPRCGGNRARIGGQQSRLPWRITLPCVSQSLFLLIPMAMHIIQSPHQLFVTIDLILFRERYWKQAAVFATLARHGLTAPLPPPRHVHPFTALPRLNAFEERSP